jgi:hypothetical protein
MALQEGGYRTVGFTDGGWMRQAMGFASGFNSYDDRGGLFQQIMPRALAWLREDSASAGRRTFLFVHAYDIHCPYESRQPFDTLFCTDHTRHLDLKGRCGKGDLVSRDLDDEDLQAISDHYDGGIASADAYVGELFDLLKATGRYEEAMIVVTSDHGDALGEHGQIGHGGLYLEQIMVPLIMKMPASWEIGRARIDAPAELVDVMPTVLQAAGARVQEDVDGHSLLPLMKGPARGRAFLTAQLTFREGRKGVTSLAKRAILEPRRRLLIYDQATTHVEAFDLQSDPLGMKDVAPGRPEWMNSLMAAMVVRDRALTGTGLGRGQVPAAGRPLEEQVSPELLEELKSLGYID